ncbi:MAG TPA: formate dehydrogenase accessory sulfurtransferase FdhD [Acidimicrobiia bacterium]|nr:formate dehydrogenase accessory sulfurtransferase FdhD [Acidimicrobiia bacterium]
MTEGVTRRRVVKVRDDAAVFDDDLVVEEPMEIRLDGTSLAVVMRTPGHDADLALGFAITEGIVTTPYDIADVVFLGDGRWNLVTSDEVTIDPAQFQRNFYSTSSCGVCGKASIDAIRITGARPPPGPVVTVDTIVSLPSKLLRHQDAFQSTGGLHAAAVFEGSGEILAVREDVGRHNAVDKVIGHLARRGWPLPSLGLMVSGRVSFEITQKAAVAGISLICGVSAASSLAVDVAEEFGMTVVGFLRDGGFTAYTGEQRIEGLS